MERNFFRRIEISYPILDARLKRRIMKEGLKSYLADNTQAWEMNADGEYAIRPTRRTRSCAQDDLLASLSIPV